ncbi:indole-3-acetic acid-induced protein ARG2-like [Senna tora]|uniref:Indole-3-acetic acid-induced protein ARG2-like n=1 Tax=Senna tora TaxID=362788 RepID=A0A834TC49_9FABA|nr:indole-3-acetic acid-induced protein ARG2-like [Senna tora]
MSRSFSNISSLLFNAVSSTIRRGYRSSTTQGLAASVARAGGASAPKKTVEERVTAETKSWVPDPVTGYYRPENTKEIDVAELRATLLGKK